MNTMSYRKYFLILIVCILSFGGSLAHAADGEWSTVASACVPTEKSVGKYLLENARLEFSGTKIGQIIAQCNITDPADLFGENPIWGLMDVTYDDTDGALTKSRVRVYLRRVHGITGASSNIATFDSNLFGAGQQRNTKQFNHVFDFFNYAYYLTIILDRTDSGLATPRIERVRLRAVPVG